MAGSGAVTHRWGWSGSSALEVAQELPAMAFPARVERLEWQLVAEVEVAAVLAGRQDQVTRLQAVLPGVAFCQAEQEFGEALAEARGLARVFRLAQLIIQYLVHCQGQLEEQVAGGEEEKGRLAEEVEKVARLNQAYEEEIKVLRKESRKRKKMLEAQQECMFKGADLREFQKCTHCAKTFINQSFLSSHLARRHGQVVRPVEGQREVGLELKELVRSVKEELVGGREAKVEELTGVVRRQQDQINDLQNSLKERVKEMVEKKEPRGEVEGRMEAQERFWQAQVRSMEEKLRMEGEEGRWRELRLQEQVLEERERREKGRERRRRRKKRETQETLEHTLAAQETAREKTTFQLEQTITTHNEEVNRGGRKEGWARESRRGEGRRQKEVGGKHTEKRGSTRSRSTSPDAMLERQEINRDIVERQEINTNMVERQEINRNMVERQEINRNMVERQEQRGVVAASDVSTARAGDGAPPDLPHHRAEVHQGARTSSEDGDSANEDMVRQSEREIGDVEYEEESEEEGEESEEEGEESEDEDDEAEEVRGLRPAVSGSSLRSEHVYEAPGSLEDLLVGSRHRLERSRGEVEARLAHRLEELGIHPSSAQLPDTELTR